MAAEPPAELFGGHLFPPDHVMRHSAELKLTEDQRASIVKAVQDSQSKFADGQAKLQEAIGALEEAVRVEKPDADGALGRLDEVLKIERELKRTQMSLLIRIKKELTSEQQTQLRKFKPHTQPASAQAKELQSRLASKLERVQAGVQRWQDEGRSPFEVAEIMQEFPQLMANSKHKEAEALLDRALKILDKNSDN